MKKIRVLIILVAFALCQVSDSIAETKVGVILPMTGDFARYGDAVRKGLEEGNSLNLKLVYEDEGCNPKSAVTAHQKLTAIDKIQIIIGPWCGSPQVAVASALSRTGQIAILGSSAPQKVYELSGGRMISVQHSIESESRFNAVEAYRQGARRVVIVFLENDFSRAHEAAFRGEFKGQVLDTLVYTSPDASALRSIVTQIKRLNPDTLYVPDAFPLMHGLITQLSSLGLGKLKIFSVYSAQSEDVLKAIGSAGEGMFLSYPNISDEALHHFPKLATDVLNKGLSECPKAEPECVLKAIKGNFKFDKYGVMEGSLTLKVVKNGKFIWNDTE